MSNPLTDSTILVHLPSYRDPELIPTLKDALARASNPRRLRFGICRQYNPEDGFDNIDQFRNDSRFKIQDVLFTEAQGLPWARAQINDNLLTDEDYVLQLDSHHRFNDGWDHTLIQMHNTMEKLGHKPIIGGYLPEYKPDVEPNGRANVPWQSQFVCFYPHGTIFIRPGLLVNWENMELPCPARFLSGHFAFARSQWARDVRHDPDIYFSGEEINLTVRSFTHGYDIFHPNRLVIWHSTMRKERDGILKWDDDSKRGIKWYVKQEKARKKIRVLLGSEQDSTIDFKEYGVGTERTIADYEAFAGVCFKTKTVQRCTIDNCLPPSVNESKWEKSFYHLVNIERHELPGLKYSSILVAFDDKEGLPIRSQSITGDKLTDFLQNGTRIHYEEYFTHEIGRDPVRMVAWAVKPNGEWAERIERILH